ncbi:uncharacterized protein LOC142162000 [Nicotiana tabacum]|uniref:Uncharacterized protein LOC142162000 n=1 Tax=Nicotiana tabacum TaxID=4097 RepID=A0AC58RNU8_TOBAC
MLAWIMNTVSPNLLSTVIYTSDAYTIGEDFRKRFDKVNTFRGAYLHKEIAILTKGASSVFVYFSRLRELWDKYETLTPPPICRSPESKKHVEHYQLQKVLMSSPLPNLNQAYDVIINVESQRINGKDVYGSNDTNEVVGMMSNRNYNNNGGFNNNIGFTNTGYTGGNKSKNLFNKSTIYCKCKGHTKDNCFKLHGYPSDFKNRYRGGTFNV